MVDRSSKQNGADEVMSSHNIRTLDSGALFLAVQADGSCGIRSKPKPRSSQEKDSPFMNFHSSPFRLSEPCCRPTVFFAAETQPSVGLLSASACPIDAKSPLTLTLHRGGSCCISTATRGDWATLKFDFLSGQRSDPVCCAKPGEMHVQCSKCCETTRMAPHHQRLRLQNRPHPVTSCLDADNLTAKGCPRRPKDSSSPSRSQPCMFTSHQEPK